MTIKAFTSRPAEDPSIIFPTLTARICVLVYFLFALWSLAFIIGSRTSGLNPFSLASWSKWSVPRLLCLGNYLMSAAFFLSAIVLLFGVGIGRNETACSTGNVVCIVFYAFAKTAVYAFLIERLRIVQPVRKRRRDSKLYKVCFGLLSPLIALLFIMLFGRIHDVDGNNVCRFGLQRHASFLVLGYDLTMITVLTSAFIWPLMRGRAEFMSPAVRGLATRSLLAAIVSMLSTAGNVIYLGIQEDMLGWVCLSCCGMDVLVNAWVLFFATIQTERTGTSNGNEDREHQAIVALSKQAAAHLRNGQGHVTLSDDGLHFHEPSGISAVLRAPISTRPVGRDRNLSFDDCDSEYELPGLKDEGTSSGTSTSPTYETGEKGDSLGGHSTTVPVPTLGYSSRTGSRNNSVTTTATESRHGQDLPDPSADLRRRSVGDALAHHPSP